MPPKLASEKTSTVKVILANGNYWITRINLDPEEATKYFLGKTWSPGLGAVMGTYPSICTAVEIL